MVFTIESAIGPRIDPRDDSDDDTVDLDKRMPLCQGVDVAEMTIEDVQRCFDEERFTSRQLVECYRERINRLNHKLCAVIEVNPDVLDIADAMDRERSEGKLRGPLHGIPFFVKDNIATKDKVDTTAGSRVLRDTTVSADATVVALLRESGAVLMGHTNMSEWACMRTSKYAESYSGRGGQCRNPYNLAATPGGSSAGSAVAVATNMCMFSIGTDTDTSIINPSDRASLVGIRPSLGGVSCEGVIPESHSFDVVGPLARTVRDAALVLDVITGSKEHKYSSAVADKSALAGAAFGMPWERVWHQSASNFKIRRLNRALEAVLRNIQLAGAEIIPTNFPSADEIIPPKGWDWDYECKQGRPDRCEFQVVATDFYNDIKAYLATLESNPYPIHSLEDIVAYNVRHTSDEGGVPGTHPAWETGQDLFDRSAATKGEENTTYRAALDFVRRKSREEGIDAALKISDGDGEGEEEGEEKQDRTGEGSEEGGSDESGKRRKKRKKVFDGLLIPVQGDKLASVQLACKAGYPVICVPVGLSDDGVPFGLGIMHTLGREETLIRFGSAIEDLVRGRTVPKFRWPNSDDWIMVGG